MTDARELIGEFHWFDREAGLAFRSTGEVYSVPYWWTEASRS